MMRVGVLRGGTDKENQNYENSLREGGDFISFVFDNLSSEYNTVDILIDKDGIWHTGGLPILPSDLMHRVDVVWNVSHPSFSNTLENFSIPHIGIPLFSYFSASSREILREHMKQIDVNMPRSIILPAYQEDFDGPLNTYAERKAKEIFQKFPGPWIVKSLMPNSDMAIHAATTYPNLVDAIEDGVSHGGSILVEELITGKDISMHTVPGFRGEDFYNMSADKISSSQKELVNNLAKDLHSHLGAKHYLNSQFIISPSGKVYLSGVDFSPNLKTDSHFCLSCDSVGAKAHHVIEHMLEQAL